MSSGAEDGAVSGMLEGAVVVGLVVWVAVVGVGLPALVVFGLGRIGGVW